MWWIGALAGALAARKQIRTAQEELRRQAIPASEMAQMENILGEMLSRGEIHSVSLTEQFVRIDPTVWEQFTLEQKQMIIEFFKRYFFGKRQSYGVKVKSDRNDQVLAEHSHFWGRTTIHV